MQELTGSIRVSSLCIGAMSNSDEQSDSVGDTLSSSPVPAADAPPPQQAPAEAQKDQPGKKGPKTCGMHSEMGSCCMLPVLLNLVSPLYRPLCRYERLPMPSGEEIMQQEFMNNCAVRTVISGVMGSALGLLFGVVMGSMDSAVGPAISVSKDHRLCTAVCCSPAFLSPCTDAQWLLSRQLFMKRQSFAAPSA